MNKERFILDYERDQLIDTKRELSSMHFNDKVDFVELCEFLNKLSKVTEATSVFFNIMKDDEDFMNIFFKKVMELEFSPYSEESYYEFKIMRDLYDYIIFNFDKE